MSSAAAVSRTQRRDVLRHPRTITRLCLLVFTAFYFTDVCLRASAKYFWYDELLTVYFSRLPTLPRLWQALKTGLESNPPGFHLLTRASEKIFGENLIGTRMPEIVSFWLLSLCLYKFVERRAGVQAGFVAMLLPMTTGAYFYAYEARPLIIVVALAAVALLCWDNALGMGRAEKGRDRRWLTGCSLALFAAYMLHCYAILLTAPFAIAELYRAIRYRRIDWWFWIALGVPLIPTFFLYMPMLRFFRAASDGTDFAAYYAAVWPEVIKFYGFLLVPCTAILLLAFALLARDRASHREARPAEPNQFQFSWEDTLLCLSFAALPAFGVLLGQMVKSPYFGRYFLSALLGFCIPFAIMTGATRSRRWIVPVLLTAISFALLIDFGRLVRHRLTGSGETLIEPSTKTEMSTTRGRPLRSFPLIVRQASENDEPIAVLEPTQFLYLLQYAPKLESRLYYVHFSDRDASLRGLRAFQPLSPIRYTRCSPRSNSLNDFQNSSCTWTICTWRISTGSAAWPPSKRSPQAAKIFWRACRAIWHHPLLRSRPATKRTLPA